MSELNYDDLIDNESPRFYIMPFGKYKGESIEEIYCTDKGYLDWCIDNLENDSVRMKIEEAVTELDKFLRLRF